MGASWSRLGRFLARAVAIAAAAAAAGTCVAVPSANAAVSCTFDSAADTLNINMSENGDDATIVVQAGQIQVLQANPCTNGNPTPAEVGDITSVDDSVGGSTTVDIRDPNQFAPGADAGPGQEIDFIVAPNTGPNDEIVVRGATGADNWGLGNAGLNTDVGTDTRLEVVTFAGEPDIWRLSGENGADTISAQGTNGAGSGAYTEAGRVEIVGGDAGDILHGGDSTTGDRIEGTAGSDNVLGFAGNDSVGGSPGDNVLNGGPGVDNASFASGNNATVDMNISGPQATGDGTNTLIDVEGLSGGDGNDTLIGDAGPNALTGGEGVDLLDGRGGNDSLIDSSDGSTATYAQAPAAVDVNLTAGTATGGAGNDTLSGVNNLIGSPFGDSLTGSLLANSITALGGNDTVSALGGSDAVDVRDGGPDTASCGVSEDAAVADQASVDTVNADCDAIAFLPEPDPGGGGNGDPADTEVSFELAGKAKQRIVEQRGVVVRALCPLEACTATASGTGRIPKPKRSPRAKLNLEPVTEAVGAGIAEKIVLRLRKKQLRAVAAALRAGDTPKVTVNARVIDAAGNSATDSLTVRAKR
jgi:Ca2+-binding RTX toxin-like protein